MSVWVAGRRQTAWRFGALLRRAGALVMALMFVAASGCTASKLGTGEDVQLTGSIQDQNGQPVPGVKVLMFKEADAGELLGGLTLAIGTLGLVCFAQQAPTFCRKARSTTSDAAGNFSFKLKGSDTQGSVGNADHFDVTADIPVTGGASTKAATTVRFAIQRTQLNLPALRPWGAPLSLSSSASAIGVSWPNLPAAYGSGPAYSVSFNDASSQRAVWAVARASSGVTVDPRVLEDRQGGIEVAATTKTSGPDANFQLTYRSHSAPFKGSGQPPSRGASCFASGTDQVSLPITPCHLTDGDLFTARPLPSPKCSGCTPAVRSAVYLDLGSSRPVSLGVVRGLNAPLTIEGSGDAASWAAIGSATSPAAVKPATTTQARYVRVRSDSGLDLSGLTEVSVW